MILKTNRAQVRKPLSIVNLQIYGYISISLYLYIVVISVLSVYWCILKPSSSYILSLYSTVALGSISSDLRSKLTITSTTIPQSIPSSLLLSFSAFSAFSAFSVHTQAELLSLMPDEHWTNLFVKLALAGELEGIAEAEEVTRLEKEFRQIIPSTASEDDLQQQQGRERLEKEIGRSVQAQGAVFLKNMTKERRLSKELKNIENLTPLQQEIKLHKGAVEIATTSVELALDGLAAGTYYVLCTNKCLLMLIFRGLFLYTVDVCVGRE